MITSSTSITITGKRSPKKILVVTGDCPSHPYACVKLATVLTETHDVTVAGPNGSALSRLRAETERHNESSSTTSKKRIGCLSIGDVSTVVHCNVRSVVDARDYSPLRIIFDAAFDRDYNPYGIADGFERMMDDQIGTYEELKRALPHDDLVYAIHTAAGTVCDAIESLRRENAGSTALPPCVVFSSLPYHSGFFRRGLHATPRSIVALPHVAEYSSPSKAFEQSGSFAIGLVSFLVRMFWMALDAHLAERAWRTAGKRTDERRASRGLPPVRDAMRYYWTNYPVLSLGGTRPYIAERDYIADNVTVVGSIRSAETSDLVRLHNWFVRAKVSRIVYAGFGTGMQLTDKEATNLARLALSLADTEHFLLLSLSKGSQERLRHNFEGVLGSEPTETGDGFLEYNNGKLRIDNDVPQENLLLSKSQGKNVLVDIFVSHMGFGGYAEAVNGGVPFVAYPAGCDQWYNAERAVEAGVAVRANPRMRDLHLTVRAAIENESMKKRSKQLASQAANNDSNQIILRMVDEICGGETSETNSACNRGAS